ncbi:MAG: M23 family metallopeptidase [Clostridia bacterium]
MFKKYQIAFVCFLSFSTFMFSFNKSSIDSNNFIYPSNISYTSSNFGYRELFGKVNYHNGVDFPVPQGSEVYATLSGVVTYADFTKTGYGNTIILLHSNGLKTLYAHLSETFIVKLGDNVVKGDVIGYVGPKILSNGKTNGNTTGPHLHFSIFNRDAIAIDPFSFKYEKRE